MAFIGTKYTAFNPKITLADNVNFDEFLADELENTEIVSGTTAVKQYAFYSMASVTAISLPNCETVGTYAFANCYYLQTLSLPLATELEGRILRNCSEMQSMTLGSVTEYKRYCFTQISAHFREVKLNAIAPFRIEYDGFNELENLEGELLTITLDTSADDYEDALDYILGLNFTEFQLYDENGSEIIL